MIDNTSHGSSFWVVVFCAKMHNCCQWLSSQCMRVDHLFSFWRRVTRYEQALVAAKQSHIIPWRHHTAKEAGPSTQVQHSDFATYNSISLLHLGARIRSPSTAHTQLLIRCHPGWADSMGRSSSSGSEPSTSAPTLSSMMQPEVHMMLHGQTYTSKPVPSWRKSPLIQESRKAEFRPLTANISAEIRPLPETLRSSLPGCKFFQPEQIAHYNQMLLWDGKLVSGVDKVAARARTKPGRLYHKFDSVCALATSKAGRLLLIQHGQLNHIFYAICYDPAHKLYNELLNMYERRWFTVSKSYGKQDRIV